MTDNFNRFREFMQLPEQEGGDASRTASFSMKTINLH